MPVLQTGKSGDHCRFRAARSAAGLSFRHPTFLCKITFGGKGSCALQPIKPRRNHFQRLPNATKKAVLLKNCSNILNSRNDNSIRLPSGEEKPPELPFNGLSFLVLQTKRKLSYWQLVFYLFHLTTISTCTSILKPPVLSKNDFLSAVSITVKLGCFLLHAKAFL